MNPFDLPGPQFLAFYILLAVATIIVVAFLRRAIDPHEAPHASATNAAADPYLIAYLRGGANEALRVATISLIDRGLLHASGTQLFIGKNVKPEHARRPIEQALLRKYSSSVGEAKEIFDDNLLKKAAEEYERELQRLRLMPDAATTDRRQIIFWTAFLFLTGVAATKIWIAISRGRYNIIFLILLWIFAWALLAKTAFPKRTVGGNRFLKDIQNLFAGLRERAGSLKPGGATNELPLLAAVFGAAMIPVTVYPWTRELFPQATASTSSGTSCGSSCGSSCGGGGCGGGCGGCGG